METVEYKDLSLTAWDVESKGKSWLMRRKEGVQQSVERSRNARCGGDGFLPYEQELSDAVIVDEVTEKLGLHNLRYRHEFSQSACAGADDGFFDSLD